VTDVFLIGKEEDNPRNGLQVMREDSKSMQQLLKSTSQMLTMMTAT
jgi:hypothetical protein